MIRGEHDLETASDRVEEVMELQLLLLRYQLLALERVAHAEGITVARLLRRMIRNHLSPRMIDCGRTARKDETADERNAT